MSFSPFGRSITLTLNTITKLSTKLAALDPNLPTRFTFLWLEFDVTSIGNLYIGDNVGTPLSATNCGRHLVPAQNHNIVAYDTGVVLSTEIFLLADNATNQINITALPIGM